ncbi:hypothetical protein PoB_000567700 [Plakobranchus ocellatus]|uniref:FLYWCH-type domain-containing protein n=1 Tax=Plakobranchus ocellatus TaxID=259542 RepID=A0AAV3Y8R1_9GAST|nr:hypothetical protein PoB_000567700 [Plakobranchus ocellatus]
MNIKNYSRSDKNKFHCLIKSINGRHHQTFTNVLGTAQTYLHLKEAILKHPLCSEDGYNEKCRNAIPLESENTDAFTVTEEMMFEDGRSYKRKLWRAARYGDQRLAVLIP